MQKKSFCNVPNLYGNQELKLKVFFWNVNSSGSEQDISWVDDLKVSVVSPNTEDNGIHITYMADYYPFGMVMPKREYQDADESYRYGFQGMEKDEDWAGAGNGYTTDFRLYDPRLGRWLSVDPLDFLFPYQSPFIGLDNNPIMIIDPLGLAGQGGDNPAKTNGKTNPKSQHIAKGPTPNKGFRTAKGEKIHNNGAGGQTLFLPQNAKLHHYNNDSKNVSKGQIGAFDINGKRYQAHFDEYNNFQGYLDKNKNGYDYKFMLGDKTYTANSMQTLKGRDDNFNYDGAFTGIRTLTADDLEKLAGFTQWVLHRRYSTKTIEEIVRTESIQKNDMLNFKHSAYNLLNINPQDLLEIDGIVYNANEAGNYLWGFFLERKGIYVSSNFIAELGSHGRHDEMWEQQAITRGKESKIILNMDRVYEYLDLFFQIYGYTGYPEPEK